MSGNTFGTIFRVTTFGESHGVGLGCVIDGCPAGVPINQAEIQAALERRRPGKKEGNPAVTSRSEADQVEILSGVFEGYSTGTPIALVIRNTSQHSSDYNNLKDNFRPGHADFTYWEKYDGFRDYRGGGRASGRETAARVAAGDVARQVLNALAKEYEIEPMKAVAYTVEAAGVAASECDFSVIEQNPMRCCDMDAARDMEREIAELAKEGDSCGGMIECTVQNMMAGLGEPVFDKLDAELAKAMLSIGAVKGFEMGEGFASALMNGSEWNDEMVSSDEEGYEFLSNHAGGVLGGISNGEDLVFRIGIKPVPSIFKPQRTVNTDFDSVELMIKGRHDVCLCPRIVPVVEAMTYLVLCDMLLRNMSAVV